MIVAMHPVSGEAVEPSRKARTLAEGISEAMNARSGCSSPGRGARTADRRRKRYNSATVASRIPPSEYSEPSDITEVTRRAIFDAIRLERVAWSGRLQEDQFLSRLYKLKELPSQDHRFRDAAGDICQHRVRNDDWEPWWVFDDPRFDLMFCSDADFLTFLGEMLHPVVRAEAEEVGHLVEMFNEHLRVDGWELYAATKVSGRPVFAGRRLAHRAHALESAETATERLGDYVNRQITRMSAATDGDPDLAIGTAKEFLETVCKSILTERRVPLDANPDLAPLVKATMKELKLAPEDVPEAARGAEQVRIALNNLASVAGRIAEMRNLYGTGHGKASSTRLLGSRHARLVVNAAATLATFLFETHEEQPPGRTD
jgi:hypothetical protein